MFKSQLIILICGILLLTILAPLVFTQFSSAITFDTNSGAIGDTIGGITAPFISFIGAILIYISFQEQVKSNKQQIENQNIDRFRCDYEEIKNEFYSVTIDNNEINSSLHNKRFESPLEIYYEDLKLSYEGNITFEFHFKYVLFLIKYFIEEVECSNLDTRKKILFIKKIYQFYHARLKYHLDNINEFSASNDYEVPFTILVKEIIKSMELKRQKYNIPDSGKI